MEECFLNNRKFKWIFVTGRANVGKSTISCSLSLKFSSLGFKTLLISFDAVKSVSIIFSHKFSNKPRKVPNNKNLWVVEADLDLYNVASVELSSLSSLFSCILDDNEFDIVIFDGESIRKILTLIDLVFKSKKVLDGHVSNAFMKFSGFKNINKAREISNKTVERLLNRNETAFIPVLVPEFKHLMQIEHLLQSFEDKKIISDFMIINKILNSKDCAVCDKKLKEQQLYVNNVHELYNTMKIVELPLLDIDLHTSNLNAMCEYLECLFK